MDAFPLLEVLAVAERSDSGLAVGARFELTPSFTIGSDAGSSLLLKVPRVARHHCRVEFKFDRWWLLDLGSAHGSMHNGARVVNVELRHLDTIGVGGLIFRFLAHEPLERTEGALERAILERPDELSRWRVYADWLLERGDELGERLARTDPKDDGRWLGLLAPLWARGALEVDWFSGLPRRLLLRNPDPGLPSHELRRALQPLEHDANFRFVRALELDVDSLRGTRTLEEVLAELLEPVQRAALPLLRELVVGPLEGSPGEATRALVQRLLPDGAKVHCHFEPWPAQPGLEVLSVPAAVKVSPSPGSWVPLSASNENFVGRLESCLVWVRAPEGHEASKAAVRVVHTDAWYAEDVLELNRLPAPFPLRLNGRETSRARLRPGDVLEVAAGLLLRFGAAP